MGCGALWRQGEQSLQKGRSEWGNGSTLRSVLRGEDFGQKKGGGDALFSRGMGREEGWELPIIR